MADFSENIFKAIDILTKKQIEAVKFDETISAVITDASRAEKGEYVVSTGGTKFTAYSSETGYKVNDAVMVTIPQGNYDNQKIIVGKQVDTNSNSALIFRSPFINFIDATKNIATAEMAAEIGGKAQYFLPNGVTANDPDRGSWPTNVLNFYNTENKVLLWASKENLGYQNFSRLGIKADFQTYLHEYETICGNYGLAVEVTFITNELTKNNTFVNVFNFDSDTYFGDIYNFSVSFSQEQIFDISEFNEFSIKQIKVYLYQRENFYDMYNKAVPYEYEVAGSPVKLAHNIIVDNLYVSLGIDTVEFINDTATLLTNNSLRYHKTLEENEDIDERNNANLKEIELRWIHRDEETGYIATVEQNKIPADYEIRWYRYKLGAPSPDALVGAHWERYYGFKSAVDESSGEWALTAADLAAGAAPIATNSLNIQFKPNVNLASEKLKAIVLKYETTGSEDFERKIATSQELEFVNDTEVQSKATVIDENTLSIRFNDDEKGNYFLYNRAGLIGKDEDGELRTLTAVFDPNEHDVYQKAPLVDAYSIKWIFPAEPTMIQPAATGASTDAEDSNKPLSPSAEHIFSNHAAETGYDGATWHNLGEDAYSVGFFIKKKLNRNATNNTIRLEVIKDGQEFTAQAQLLFGTAGSSGSDYTIVLTWDNGQNAFTAGQNTRDNPLTGQLILMDQSGQPITAPEGEWSCEWYKVNETGVTSDTELAKETKKVKYPVIPNANVVNVRNLKEGEPDQRDSVTYSITSGTTNYRYNPSSKKFTTGTASYPYLYATTNSELTKLEFFPIDTVIPNPNPDPNNPDACLPITSEDEPEKPTNGVVGIEPSNPNSDEWTTWWGQQTGDYQTAYTEWKYEYDAYNIRRAEQEALEADCNTYTTYKGQIFFSNDGKATYYYSVNKRLFIKQDNMYILDPWATYSDVETYYYPQYTTERELVYNHLNIACDNEDNSKVVVTPSGSASGADLLKDLYLIKVKLTGFGDYPLEALFPLPIKNRIDNASGNWVVDYIEGPTDVRYSTTGETDFDKNVYQITARKWNTDDKIWEVYRHGYKDNGNDLNGYWRLVNFEYETLYQNGISTDPIYLPQLIETATPALSGDNFDIPKLDPPGIYFKESPLCGVSFYRQVGANPSLTNDVILWTQPLLMYQDNYPSTTLNKWNGQDIITDDETGSIVANALAAGKKERDNTFTGVVMGDWSRTDSDPFLTEQTGVYGFEHGAMSYALRQDGTAFFGKDGHGRIYFNGNKAQIYSAFWKEQKRGMLLDVDDGYIDIHGATNAHIYISPDGTSSTKPYFLIQDAEGKDLLRVQNSKYYLQTSNFDTSAGTGTKIDLNSGTITSYNFTIKALTGSNNAKSGIHMTSKGLPYLDIQDNGKHLIYIRKPISANLSGEYYLQSSDYQAHTGNNLSTGNGIRIDLASGKIIGYNFAINAYHTDDQHPGAIYINSNDSLYPFKIYGTENKQYPVYVTYEWKQSDDSQYSLTEYTDVLYKTKTGTTKYAVYWPSKKKYYQVTLNADITSSNYAGVPGTWVPKTGTDVNPWDGVEVTNVERVYFEDTNNLKNNVSISWDGKLYANDAQISGTITGSTINGSNITGTSINSSSITGTNIQGGTITAGTISGGSIVGALLRGNLDASGGTISGGTLSGGYISGGSAQIGGCSIDSNGDVTITGSLTVTGTTSLTGNVTIGSRDSGVYITSAGGITGSLFQDVDGTLYSVGNFMSAIANPSTSGWEVDSSQIRAVGIQGIGSLGLGKLAFYDDIKKKFKIHIKLSNSGKFYKWTESSSSIPSGASWYRDYTYSDRGYVYIKSNEDGWYYSYNNSTWNGPYTSSSSFDLGYSVSTAGYWYTTTPSSEFDKTSPEITLEPSNTTETISLTYGVNSGDTSGWS